MFFVHLDNLIAMHFGDISTHVMSSTYFIETQTAIQLRNISRALWILLLM